MLNHPNCAALDRLLDRKDTVVQRVTFTPCDQWPLIVDTFVSGLIQLHPSGLAIALCVLVDLHRQLGRVLTERFGSVRGEALDIDSHVGDCATIGDACARYSSASIVCSFGGYGRVEADLVDRFALLVRSNLCQRLTAREIAVSLGCSKPRLVAAVRVTLRCTVKEYVRRQRLEKASVLIGGGDKIESVISSVGYRNRTSFFRDFRRRFGLLPSEARERRMPPICHS